MGSGRRTREQAAVEPSGRDRHQHDASAAIRLLGHIRSLFVAEKLWCGDLIDLLNSDDELPYGGWSDGKGISTRELGKKLSPYGILAKSIRVGEKTAKGYERAQFDDAWSRYLPVPVPVSDDSKGDTGTTRMVEPDSADSKEAQTGSVLSFPREGRKPCRTNGCACVPLWKPECGYQAPRRARVRTVRRPCLRERPHHREQS